MSDKGVPVEEIARLAGHTSCRTTEIVYRRQPRPVMEKGAQALDQLFGRTASPEPANARSRHQSAIS